MHPFYALFSYYVVSGHSQVTEDKCSQVHGYFNASTYNTA